VQVTPQPAGQGIVIDAVDLGRTLRLDDTCTDDEIIPLQATIRNALATLELDADRQALHIRIMSDIPIASGMGSGTAVATALVRAICRHYERDLPLDIVSELVYRTEILLHGTPSGIDNTVVAYEQPVYFVRGRGVEVFSVGQPFTLLIGDTGVPARTRDAVTAVRLRRDADEARYDALFDEISAAVDLAREAMAQGDLVALGRLMNENHALLQAIDVSGAELDRLVCAAREAGAWGAKLSGGGMGGCMIALAGDAPPEAIADALRRAGARRVIITVVR
jgi:mevalonate kinase